MRLIRKGNDIGVVWSIYAEQDGSVVPYSLYHYNGTARNISLFLETGKNKYEIKDFTIVSEEGSNVKNSIKFTFWGKDQIAAGAYILTMVENKGQEDMRVLDYKNAFAIVRHSWEVGGEDSANITTETVELSSDIGDIIDERLIPDTIARRTDFADYLPLSGASAMTGDLDMGSNKIVNLSAPTSDTDAANKKYVDDGIAALDGTITLASPSSTVTPNAAQNAGTVIPVVSSFTLKERDGKLIEKGTGSTDSKVGTTYVDAGGSALKALNDAKSYADTKDAEINAKIPSEASSSNKLADKAYVDTKDAAINAKIPSAASSSNQLADKDWVKAINDLTNYYTKSQTYTKTEVNNIIGSLDQFKYEIYASISAITSPKSNVLYLIGPTGSGADKYEEYVYANSTFTKIGDTSIDLSPYVKKDGSVTMTGALNMGSKKITNLATPTSNTDASTKKYVDDGLATKQATLVSGTNIKTVNNTSLLGSGNVAVQPTLVSGTNIKTINNESLLGSGNITISSGSTDIYWATYGTTNFSDVATAYNAGKTVLCIWDEDPDYFVCHLVYFDDETTDSQFNFTAAVSNEEIVVLTLDYDDTWGNSRQAIHSIPSGGSQGQVLAKSSGTDYAVSWVNQSGGGVTPVTSWNNPPLDTNVPSEKLVKDSLDGKQVTLIGSGTGQNIKTVNNTSILGSGNIDATAIFPVTVSGNSPTTFAEIEAAIAAGKVPMILSGEDVHQLVYYLEEDSAIFTSFYGTSSASYTIDANDTITFNGVVLEDSNNKVSSLSSASTDAQYPSAKCVYDTVNPTIVTVQPVGGMLPNVLYNLGTLTGTVTFSLNTTDIDSDVANHYYWTFDTSTTAPTITWPTGISWKGGSAPTVSASKHYEVSVLGGIGVSMEV